jgi:aldose 1-epimerase
MSLKQTSYGTTRDDRPVHAFTLDNGGVSVTLTEFGGHILEIHTPDRTGRTANINLAYEQVGPLVEDNPYFGGAIGRVANRIAKGKFTLDGKEYTLPINNGPNSLHGGKVGWDKLLWTAEQVASDDGDALRMTLVSPDGDEGYPGTVTCHMTYTLTKSGDFRIDYHATTDKPTPLNLTHHPYFNLAGAGNGAILDHHLTIHADHYTPVDKTLIPTGEVAPVANTPFDFTTPHRIGERIAQVPGGYDHNFCLRPTFDPKSAARDARPVTPAALVREETTGRHMEILTDQPGIQFYSGNFLKGTTHTLGGSYPKHGGFCLETQKWPDAVNHPHFPSTILRPGETYKFSTVHRFFAK